MTSPKYRSRSRSWDALAPWYSGWVGKDGSRYHQQLAMPLLLRLLEAGRGEAIADLGCGPGILAPPLAKVGAAMLGVDLSPRLIATARRHHGRLARFEVADATRLPRHGRLEPASFDAATFLLSIQDIAPLEEAIASAAWLLKPRSRIAMVMLHPCFRVPRQSGWGFDEARSLTYRRVDSYLSPLDVPMQPHPDGRGTTRSYHRPLGVYAETLGRHGFAIARLEEVADDSARAMRKADSRAAAEFPLLLGIRAERG